MTVLYAATASILAIAFLAFLVEEALRSSSATKDEQQDQVIKLA